MDGAALLDRFVRLAGHPSIEHAVAAHTVFLAPETVAQCRGGALFPVVRDPRRRGELGRLPDGREVLFDDNTTPTDAFLWAAGRAKGRDVQFNHVWPSASDPGAYTALWNLCCTPAFLAKATDTHAPTVAALRFRAWQLYGCLPVGTEPPVEPAGFADLPWAAMTEPIVDLERVLRDRMRAAPLRRATQVAARIGWLFSEGPDRTLD
jgi:hypothetical protein